MKSAGTIFLEAVLNEKNKQSELKRKSSERLENKINDLIRKYKETRDESYNQEAERLILILERGARLK